jgi:predicted RNase H-like nuclease (RuvC/YqgF family)
MSDLIERLRSCSEDFRVEYREAEGCSIYAEAADEIERLQKRVSDADECIEEQEEEIERLRSFVKAFDEMDECQPYDGYYIALVEKVWKAREVLEAGDD